MGFMIVDKNFPTLLIHNLERKLRILLVDSIKRTIKMCMRKSSFIITSITRENCVWPLASDAWQLNPDCESKALSDKSRTIRKGRDDNGLRNATMILSIHWNTSGTRVLNFSTRVTSHNARLSIRNRCCRSWAVVQPGPCRDQLVWKDRCGSAVPFNSTPSRHPRPDPQDTQVRAQRLPSR